MQYIYNTTELELQYESFINNYFIEKNINDPELKNYEISFEFYEYETSSKKNNVVYFFAALNIIDNWNDGIYDLMIFDDRFLFSEISDMELEYVEYYLHYCKPSLELLEDLSDYINEEDINFHDQKVLNDGKFENKIYGLPYEIDFNVLYYDNENSKAKEIVENIEDLTWDNVWNKLKPSNLLNIALGDDNSFLDFFAEYTNSYYNVTKEYDKNFYKLFYNETGENLYQSFINLIKGYSGIDQYNVTSFEYLSSLKDNIELIYLFSAFLSYDDAYNDFLNGNSTAFYRGRASHYPFFYLNDYSNIGISLPPKYLSTVTEQYLVVNKQSKIDKKILTKIALQLTSKDFQLLKAEYFGSIPTFDLNKIDKYSEISDYCQLQPELCNIMIKMKKIYLKEMFKSKYSAPFFEIMIHLPFRKLPYIKVISPKFCKMVVLGCTMNMINALQYMPPFSMFKIKFFHVYEAICTSLIYIPMFAITFRIYTIYQTKSFNSNFLSNKSLLYIIIILILIPILYRIIIVFSVDEFRYEPFGNISTTRFPGYGYVPYNDFYEIFFHIVFILLLFMIISTGRVSKKFGDICYIFITFVLNISDFFVERLFEKLNYINYEKFFLLIICINGLVTLTCIYILVGSRVFFVMFFSDDYSLYELKENKNTPKNIIDFIPLKAKKKDYMFLMENGNNKKDTRSSDSKSFSNTIGTNYLHV
eukprot:jgi/Orpsp1_1/1175596/evm.model.c7180000054472.1